MAVKISGMMGTGSMGHNNRKFITENVDPARTEQNITLRRENLKQVYHELFDEALAEYNAKKTKTRDKIPDYYRHCALPGFVDSKNEEKTERNAGYLVVSHSGGGMLRQGTRKGIRRTPANRGMRAHRIVKSLDISEDVCHGLCP